MLSIDQVKQIAEYMGLPCKIDDEYGVIANFVDRVGIYNPVKSDELSCQVFKALVDECKKRGFRIEIEGGKIIIYRPCNGNGMSSIFNICEFNNESICLAFLKVMESI